MADTKKKAVKKAAPKKANLYEKIYNVQHSVVMARKGGENTHHKFKYSRDTDIIDSVKGPMKEQRLTYIYTTDEFVKNETDSKKRMLKIRFWLINVDNPVEREPYDVFSEGENKEGSVVGLPVAYTMALKYFLSKAFLIETGDDAEVDKRKGTKPAANETPEQKFEKAKKMIAGVRDVTGLIAYSLKLKEKNSFDKKQVAELQKLISSRVDELENK